MTLPEHFFVTGTDTDVGKTFVAQALLRKAILENKKAYALKPVAAGVSNFDGKVVNEDVYLLNQVASEKKSYEVINPCCVSQPMSPHIAARIDNVMIDVDDVALHCQQQLAESKSEFVLVEGAGGWFVPLTYGDELSARTMADLAITLQLPVIMVVGMRLGCLNHALLTYQAIKQSGLLLAGWVANQVDPSMLGLDDNIETLSQMINAPLLGVLPFFDVNSEISSFNGVIDEAAEKLTLPNIA